MKILSSLLGRIFLASSLLAVLSIGVALYLVNVRVTREAQRELQREILATGALVDQLRTIRTETFTVMARLIADLPKLKAAVETNDPPTVRDIAGGYQQQLDASLVLVTNRSGEVLYTSGGSPRAAVVIANQPAVREALIGRESFSLLPNPKGILQVVTVPISLGLTHPEMLGTLSVGFLLDDAFAAQLKAVFGSDLAFGMDGQILAATRPRSEYPQLAERLRAGGIARLQLGGEEYETLSRPLTSSAPGPPDGPVSTRSAAPGGAGPVAIILRSRMEQVRSLREIRTRLAATAVVAVLLATLLSFAVARTITRPMAAITGVMRDVAATGDLTRKIALREGGRWDDEDARLLATTFNTLTDSVARFQREMSHKERLTSLGRLSTVIAHEVRNPLMIIKAALHGLQRPDVSPASLREAVADIDEEVVRLNRLVNEVLDFARPIRFELTAIDLNALCRESAAASETAEPGVPVTFALDPDVSPVMTDPERLRIALVNMLGNARQAVTARAPAPEPATAGAAGSTGSVLRPNVEAVNEPLVELRTKAGDGCATVVIADRGVGIKLGDLSQVFDPYFTTKRGGTGLGLAIAKNIVEALGGTIRVNSTPGRGTEFRIELPTTAGSDVRVADAS